MPSESVGAVPVHPRVQALPWLLMAVASARASSISLNRLTSSFSQPLYILSLQGLADGAWTSRTGRKDWVQRLKNTTDVRDLAKAALEFEMALRREVLNLAWHSSDSFQRAAKRRGRKSKAVLEKERERQARQSDIDFDELRRAGVRSIRITNLPSVLDIAT